MALSYEEGKLFEKIIDQQNQIIAMLQSIGDMVYSTTPKKERKRRKQQENEEDDEEELSEDDKIELEIQTAKKEEAKEIRNLTR